MNDCYTEEVEVGYTPKLLKEILGDKIPYRVLGGDHPVVHKDFILGSTTANIVQRLLDQPPTCVHGPVTDHHSLFWSL